MGQRCRCGTPLNDAQAAIWSLDCTLVACCRDAEQIARADAASEISIAHFIMALAVNHKVTSVFAQHGCQPEALRRDVAQELTTRRNASATQRIGLSDALNALLRAAEVGASHAGLGVVSVDVLFATLIQNAAQDPALGVFRKHVHAHRPIISGQTDRAARRDGSHVLRAQARSEGAPGATRMHRDDRQPATDRSHHMDAARDGEHATMGMRTGGMQTGGTGTGLGQQVRETHFRSSALGNVAQHSDVRSTDARRSWTDTSGRSTHALSASRQSNARDRSVDTGAQSQLDEILRVLRGQDRRLERLEQRKSRARSGSRKRMVWASVKNGPTRSRDRSLSHASESGSNGGQNSASHGRSSQEADRGNRLPRSSYDRDMRSGWSERDSRPDGRDGRTTRERVSQSSSHQSTASSQQQRTEGGTTYRSAQTSDAQRDARRDQRRQRDRRSDRTADRNHEKRFYLSLDDDLVEAPSIGPKTAARFTPIGIHTVRDFLAADADATAAKLNVRHITAEVIADWQDQARLVCTVPWLRGTHAQLLVGADYRSAKEIATADLGEVLAGILRFAATSQGERVLRTNPPPERDKVGKWIEFARQADVTRAA